MSKRKAKKQTQFRQGDVFVRRVDQFPAEIKPRERENGAHVLAHGEATGHAHKVVERRAEMFDGGGGVYLSLPAPAALTHEEHSAIPLPSGKYEVIRQREYSPETIRNVAD